MFEDLLHPCTTGLRLERGLGQLIQRLPSVPSIPLVRKKLTQSNLVRQVSTVVIRLRVKHAEPQQPGGLLVLAMVNSPMIHKDPLLVAHHENCIISSMDLTLSLGIMLAIRSFDSSANNLTLLPSFTLLSFSAPNRRPPFSSPDLESTQPLSMTAIRPRIFSRLGEVSPVLWLDATLQTCRKVFSMSKGCSSCL